MNIKNVKEWWQRIKEERQYRAEARQMLNIEGAEALEWERLKQEAETREPNEFRDVLTRRRVGMLAGICVGLFVTGAYGWLFWTICHP